MTHVTCRLTARTGIGSGTLRSVIEYGPPFYQVWGAEYCDEGVCGSVREHIAGTTRTNVT